MVVAFGKVNAFNLSQDEWPLYVERLGYVFKVNGISEETKKRAVFLSVIGASNYNCYPVSLLQKSLEKIVGWANSPYSRSLQNSETFQISCKISETKGISHSLYV